MQEMGLENFGALSQLSGSVVSDPFSLIVECARICVRQGREDPGSDFYSILKVAG